MTGAIDKIRKEIATACERRGVARLDVFGSWARGDFDPRESDLDFLVDLKPMDPYARVEAYFGLLEDLRALLGRDVDLVMVDAVKNPYIARDIQETKRLLYAA